MIKTLTCIVCPRGSGISVETEGEEILSIRGNSCPRGAQYARDEMISPMRTLTSTVRCEDGSLLPVKTDKSVPKGLLFEIMREISRASAPSHVKAGYIIIENVLNTGANIIATQSR